MFEDLSKTLKIEPRKLEATEELSFTTDEDTTFTPEIRQKIQLCLDDPSYINKHSLILDLNAEVESFDIVIDQLLKFFKTAPLYADLVFSLIRTTLQYYTTPNEFPVDRIREIQTLTTNDLQWQDAFAMEFLKHKKYIIRPAFLEARDGHMSDYCSYRDGVRVWLRNALRLDRNASRLLAKAEAECDEYQSKAGFKEDA